jgi:hypothetical protein
MRFMNAERLYKKALRRKAPLRAGNKGKVVGTLCSFSRRNEFALFNAETVSLHIAVSALVDIVFAYNFGT